MAFIPRKKEKGKHHYIYSEAEGKVKTKAKLLKEALGKAAASERHEKWIDFIPGKFTLQCYDSKTEILTDHGWKLFEDLKPEDKVGSLSRNGPGRNLELKFEVPEKIWAQEYDGELYYLKNKRVSLAITPEHNLYYLSGGKGRNWRTVFAERAFKRDKKIVMNPGILDWIGKLHSPSWFEFLGFWFGDGTFNDARKEKKSRNYRISFTQKSKKDYLEELIRRIGLDGKLRRSKREPPGTLIFSLEGKEFANYFSRFGKKKERSIPAWIRNADKTSLLGFLNGFTKADGYKREEDWRLMSSNKKLIDQLQEMALKAGLPGVIYHEFEKTEFSPQGRDLYILSLRRKRKLISVKKSDWDKKSYRGMVYSVKVPSGIILVRRNGFPCLSGNCHGWFEKDKKKGYTKLSQIKSEIKKELKAGRDPIEKLKGKWHYDLRVQKKSAPSWWGLTPFKAPWTGTAENKTMGTIKGYQVLAKGGKKLQKFLRKRAEKEMAKEGIAERRDRIEWMKVKAQWFKPDSPGNPQKNRDAAMIAIEFFKPACIHRRELDFMDVTFFGKYLKGRYYNRLVERKISKEKLKDWQKKAIKKGKTDAFYDLKFYFWKAKDQWGDKGTKYSMKDVRKAALGKKSLDRIRAPDSKKKKKGKKKAKKKAPLATKEFH